MLPPIIVYHWSGFRLEEGVIWSPYQSVSDQVSFLSCSFHFASLSRKQTAGSLLSGAGDDGVLQSLPKSSSSSFWWNAVSRSLCNSSPKRWSPFSSHRWKNTRLGTVWQKHALSPCPQITWHLPGTHWLGLGLPCIPGESTQKNCPVSHSLQAKGDGFILEWFFHCWRVNRDPRIHLHCFRARRRSCFGPFQDLYQSALLWNKLP